MANPHRLRKTFEGHKHELLAAFARSAAHKLPGAKGSHREDAVSRFLATWVPHRYSPATNVFATSPDLGEFNRELDLVLHDSYEGGRWPLDGDKLNTIVTWEEVRAVLEIKSELNERTWSDACRSMHELTVWAGGSDAHAASLPLRVLFSFRTAPLFFADVMEKFSYAPHEEIPFDAIVLLDEGAWFGPRLELLEIGLQRGLVPSQVERDGPSLDRIILRSCMETRIPEHFRCAGVNPEEALLALAVLTSYCCMGERITRSLLAALTRVEYACAFQSDEAADESSGLGILEANL